MHNKKYAQKDAEMIYILLITLLSWREVQVLIIRGRLATFVQFNNTARVYIRIGGRNHPTKYKDL
ncbi:MAG: hypothetical protein KJO48_02645 [Ignavibacteria bacterium]|nr:hypothetical protein [Ignavibacteria bacterium]